MNVYIYYQIERKGSWENMLQIIDSYLGIVIMTIGVFYFDKIIIIVLTKSKIMLLIK